MAEFKVGQTVQCVDTGATYSTYFHSSKKEAPEFYRDDAHCKQYDIGKVIRIYDSEKTIVRFNVDGLKTDILIGNRGLKMYYQENKFKVGDKVRLVNHIVTSYYKQAWYFKGKTGIVHEIEDDQIWVVWDDHMPSGPDNGYAHRFELVEHSEYLEAKKFHSAIAEKKMADYELPENQVRQNEYVFEGSGLRFSSGSAYSASLPGKITPGSQDWVLDELAVLADYKNKKKTIMSKITTMMKKLLDGQTRKFIEAGFLDSNLEMTTEGYKALHMITFEEHKAKLEAAADERIAEIKAEKEACK